MAIQSLYDAEIETWKNIRQIATSLAETAKNVQQFPKSFPPPSNSSKPNLLLDLPFPHIILERILTSELPERTRQKLINSVTQRVNELRASLSVAGLHYDHVLQQAFQRLYQERFIPIVDSHLQSLLASSTKRQHSHHDRRPAFNAEYTPFLEKYFEHNAYPSAADRSILACKSMMTPRQIEVWFQNHRNRAKKDGKILKRLSSSLALDVSLAFLAQKVPSSTGPAIQRLSTPTDDSSDEELEDVDIRVSLPVSPDTFLNTLSPPHAFPTRFPPIGCKDPFPNTNGIFHFPSPSWTRTPVTSEPPSESLNVDQLTAMFASKLNLHEDVAKAQTQRNNSTACGRPWFAATVTVPSPAPHPALLRTSCMHSTSPLAPDSLLLDLNRATRGGLTSPSPRTHPPSQNVFRNRKLAPFSRRTPPNAGPAISPPSVPSLGSRTSSFSSTTSSQSRSTSSSSTSVSSVDSISPLFSPISQARSMVHIENFGSCNEYINTRSQPHSNDIFPLDLGLLAKQIPPFAQYQTSPLLTISAFNYLTAQS